MGLGTAAREHLPAGAQDLLRSLRDASSPRRRRAARAPAGDDALLARVSPQGRVLAGPFAGMTMATDARFRLWGAAAARLAGTYEEELFAALEARIAARPGLVIDIGAAEGYYAVGMSRRLPASRIVAFEIDPRGRALCRRNARLNGVGNLVVRGRVTPPVLQRLLRGVADGLVICDCEGYEMTIIDPVPVPALRSCALVVELHELDVPGVTAAVTGRFRATHEVELVDAVPRSPAARPQLAHLCEDEIRRVIDEGRLGEPPMQWAVMLPRTAGTKQ